MSVNLLKERGKVKVYSIEFEDELLTEIIEIDKVNNIIKIAFQEDIFAMKPQKDERISIKIPGEDALYYFNTKVEEVNEEGDYFVIKIPSELERKQDRNFVRININISLDVMTDKIKTKAVSTNISGGGICFFCKTHFTENQIVDISFRTTYGKVYKDMKLEIKHIRVLSNNIFEYGSEFVGLNPLVREELISYLFELEIKRKSEEGKSTQY